MRHGSPKSCGCIRREITSKVNLILISVGEKFGKLVVVEYNGKRCLCQCECGRKSVVMSTKLRTGKTRSCGCLREMNNKDTAAIIAPGSVFNRLTLMSQDGAFGTFKCECGNEITVKTIKVRSGHTKSCGCLVVDHAVQMSKDKVRPYGETAFNGVFAQYVCNAKSRGVEFKLSKDDVKLIVGKPCYYCGLPPSNVKIVKSSIGKCVYSGIDRVNSSDGYTHENVVPCCIRCNNAKYDLSEEELLLYLKRLRSYTVPNETVYSKVLIEGLAELERDYATYKSAVIHKGRKFEIEFEKFRQIVSSNCHYCGVSPGSIPKKSTATYARNGIDRVDSGIGYITGNMVPCCWMCNRAKSDSIYEDFIRWIDFLKKPKAL